MNEGIKREEEESVMAGKEQTGEPGGWKKRRKEQIRKLRKEQRRKKKARSTIANKIGTTVFIVFIFSPGSDHTILSILSPKFQGSLGTGIWCTVAVNEVSLYTK